MQLIPTIRYRQLAFGLWLLLGCSTACIAQPRRNTSPGLSHRITIPLAGGGRLTYDLRLGSYSVNLPNYCQFFQAYGAYGEKDTVRTTREGARSYSKQPISDAIGKGTLHLFDWRANGLRMQQLFYVYEGKSFFLAQLKVRGRGVGASYISPLTTGTSLAGPGLASMHALYVPFDNDMWARYDARPVDKAAFTSSEVTALYSDRFRYGFIIGSVEHGVWKTGIRLPGEKGGELAVYGGLSDHDITHDKIPHGKVSANDTLCASPRIFIGAYPDWRDGMEEYAAVNRLLEPPVKATWKKATPMGWNSWGSLQTKLNPDNAKGVVDFFRDSLKGFRNAGHTLYIDLDSYWDNLVKGGLNGDLDQLRAFVQYCKQHGFVPGIYWAPFADWGKHDRPVEDGTGRYPDTWLLQQGKPVEVDGAYAMDPTHPDTKARMAYYFDQFKALGFEMIKVDFLGHGAMESERFHDPNVTTGMQAYAQGMRYLDSVAGNAMLLYAAISPTLATGRYVHMRRIACDAFSAIDNTEYTLNSTGYGWWQHKLYDYVDADHVVFNREQPGANRARLASALVTGTLITGDDFSSPGPWRATARTLLQNEALLSVARDGRPFRPYDAHSGNRAPHVFVKRAGNVFYLAAFNYDNQPATHRVSLERAGLPPRNTYFMQELFTGQAGVSSYELTIDVPAADVKLYRITFQ